MPRSSRWALVFAAAAGLSMTPACGGMNIYGVQTTLAFGDRGEAVPEVVAARRRAPLAHPERVAIVWPSHCANETSAAQRGDAESGASLASNDCALEISAFERVLLSAGYQVYHWDAIRRRALANDISPEAAAEQLGIGLLLRVNSLERSGVVPGSDARWQRDYYHSDSNHTVGPSAVVHPNIANQIERFAEELEDEVVRGARLAVTLDVTAVHAPSGEVSWFYRWTHQDSAQQQVAHRFFVLCNSRQCTNQGVERASAAPDPGPRSGSTRALSVQQEASVQRVTYARLMFEAITDLVQRLPQLESGQAPAAPAAPAAAPGPAQ